MRQFVLIGGGHAAASAARMLRRDGFDGHIVIVGDEPHAPYQRPPLSKEHLTGEPDLDEVWSVTPQWCADNRVELRLGVRATAIDTEKLSVTLETGESLPADAVLIATGVRPRKLPNVLSRRVHYLKTLEDADSLRVALAGAKRIAIVGAGFIGMEAAAAAISHGADVTILEAAAVPLAPILGEEIGEAVANLHRNRGVTLHTGVTVETIEDVGDEVRIRTTDGTTVMADAVIVGIGVIPNDEIARASEITVGNGVRVDQFCRTSAAGVFAAGDVANHYHSGIDGRVRVEHFDNAARQGAVAARNMLGHRTEYTDVHWFWSDQYDSNLQFAGHTADADRVVVRGSLEAADFTAFYMKGAQVVAAFAIDRGGEVMAAKTLIAERREVSDTALQDEDIDLAEMVFAQPDAEDQADGDDATFSIEEAGFERVARSGQIGENMVRRFQVGDLELAVARSAGSIYALHNVCTHLACKLAAGKVDSGGLTCLCHGSIFELATGIPINPPATKPVRTFPAIERDGQIFVKVS